MQREKSKPQDLHHSTDLGSHKIQCRSKCQHWRGSQRSLASNAALEAILRFEVSVDVYVDVDVDVDVYVDVNVESGNV